MEEVHKADTFICHTALSELYIIVLHLFCNSRKWKYSPTTD